MLSVGFVLATPDGPLMAGWACCLYLTVRASQTRARRDFVLLGVALAFALLSKMFAFALVAGIVAWSLAPRRRALWREGLALSFVVAAVLYVPFVIWNAEHHWVTFAFAFQQRHVVGAFADPAVGVPGRQRRRVLARAVDRGAAGAGPAAQRAAGLDLAAAGGAAGAAQLPRADRAALDLRAVRLAGVGMGVAFVSLAHRARVLWATAGAVPAAVLIPFLFLAAAFPGPLYEQFRATGSTLRNSGPFEIFTYWPLAQDVRRMADANDAVVVTDGYGFSSQMDYEAGIPPVVIGYDRARPGGRALVRRGDAAQAHAVRRQGTARAAPGHPEDKPGRPDFQRRLGAGVRRRAAGPDLEYSYTDPDRPHRSGAHVFPDLVRGPAAERDPHPALGRRRRPARRRAEVLDYIPLTARRGSARPPRSCARWPASACSGWATRTSRPSSRRAASGCRVDVIGLGPLHAPGADLRGQVLAGRLPRRREVGIVLAVLRPTSRSSRRPARSSAGSSTATSA